MGKTYYAGVPGMHEQFGPMVGSMARKGLDSTRQHRQEADVKTIIMAFIIGIPVMPFWAGLMLIRESLHMFFRTFPDTPERAQSVFNMKFAAFFLVLGITIWSFALS